MLDNKVQRLRSEAAQRSKRDMLIEQLPMAEAVWLQAKPFEYIDTIRDMVGRDIFSVADTLPLPDKLPGFSEFLRWESDDRHTLMEQMLRTVSQLSGNYWVRMDEGPFYQVKASGCYVMLRTVGHFSDTLEVVHVNMGCGMYMNTFAGELGEDLRSNEDGLIHELIKWRRDNIECGG